MSLSPPACRFASHRASLSATPRLVLPRQPASRARLPIKMDHTRSAEPARMVHQLCPCTYFWGEAAGAGIDVGALAAGPVTGTMTQRVTAT
jgi:hypothetical protein